MSHRRMDTALAFLALLGLVSAVMGIRWVDRESLQTRYDAWRITGERPEAPPAISGATLAVQEAL